MILTVEQVAERLSLTTRHVRELLQRGSLPGFKRGIRVWGVMLADLEKWIKAKQKAGAK